MPVTGRRRRTITRPGGGGAAAGPDDGHMARHWSVLVAIASILATIVPPAYSAAPSRAELRIVRLINRERARNHLSPLRVNVHLVDAARYHSREMLRYGYFDHNSLHPARAWDRRVRSFLSRSVVGEALAWGAGTLASPSATVRMWMASPPHRRILLDPTFRVIGIGRVIGRFDGTSGAAMVTADFAGKR
jgi:uncharacterized protein YkwD